MSTVLPRRPPNALPNAPTDLRGGPPDVLCNGDQLTREEFHRLYERTPDGFKAELIGGIVHVASPVSRRHASLTNLFNMVLGLYKARTPGVEALDNGTIILDEDKEPQPDLSLRILPEHGGRSANTPDGDYVLGPPELLIEVASSSRAIDLHAKREDYAGSGAAEYLVWVVRDGDFVWFDLTQNVERPIPGDGVVRSIVFPGLWLDREAIRSGNDAQVIATLEAGLATPEHAAFVRKLAEADKSSGANE